jgi:Holliday junction resolvase RusA-like endonuclease
MTGFTCFFAGHPAKKGSARARGKVMPDGRVKAWTINSDDKAKDWEAYVRLRAQQRIEEEGVMPDLTAPVKLSITFRLHRPKKHYRTGKRERELRDDAPRWHVTRPDFDKMTRSLVDGLTGVAYLDDSQVCQTEIGKEYADLYGEQEGAFVRVLYLTATASA